MLRSIGCGKPHADRCFCIGAIVSLILGKTRDTSLGGVFEVEWVREAKEILITLFRKCWPMFVWDSEEKVLW